MNRPAEAGNILVAEDDQKTAALIALYLEKQGFRPLLAYEGQAALTLFEQEQPSLVILDLMLPGLDGWQVCRRIRQSSKVPIIMLTARGEEEDRVLGLELGADDYVVKPFSPRELMARVQAVLRRSRPEARAPGRLLQHRGLRLQTDKRTARLNDRPLPLTPHEYTLLSALMSAPGRVFTRAELLEHLYPQGEAVVDRVVDVHIGKLRQKVEPDTARPRYILTVRGMGYRFAEPDE